MILATLIVLFISGIFFYKQFLNNKSLLENSPANPVIITKGQTGEPDLISVYNSLKIQEKLSICEPPAGGCYGDLFSLEEKKMLAVKYNVMNKIQNDSNIYVELHNLATMDVAGTGGGYVANKAFISTQKDPWYWEVGACSTNKRIFVNAVSGASGPVHDYVYCGGTP